MATKGILITGGTGLVGAYAAGMLLERGERPVVFDVALNERLLSAVGVDPAQLPLVRGDMMDLPALISVLRDYDCDRVIHLAAFLGEEVQRRPYSGVRLNFMGTVNLFEAARLENVRRVIFPSSGTVYLGSLGEGLSQIDDTIKIGTVHTSPLFFYFLQDQQSVRVRKGLGYLFSLLSIHSHIRFQFNYLFIEIIQ